MITNLALKGGGVKGIAYVGALRELEKRNMLQGIKRVSGTSAGSIVAGMVCAGYSPDQIEKLMQGMDFKKFESGWNPFRLLKKYGLYTGDYILKFIHKFMDGSPKGLNPKATFKDLHDAGCKNLYCFATNLCDQSITEFSYDATPDTIVAEAIRASMSIPLFFKAWKFTNGIPNDHLYVDGGVCYNYPLSFFDDKRFHDGTALNMESLGLFLHAKESSTKSLDFGNHRYYIKHLFESLMNAQDIGVMKDNNQVGRTIFIDDLGLSATDFKLSDQDKLNLVASGQKGAEEFFEKKS